MFLIWQVSSLNRPRPRYTQNTGVDDTISYDNNTNDRFCEITDNNDMDNAVGNLTLEDCTGATASSSSSSSSQTVPKTLTLNVKYRHSSYTVEVPSDQSVADLKSTILKSFLRLPTTTDEPENDSPSLGGNYRLIHCGCPLKEKTFLQDLNLENESFLHVIQIDPKETLQLSSNGFSGLGPSDYFIYCPACKGIQSSKLRTKCLKCSTLNSFLIGRDHEPRCREDVLASPTVHGRCSSLNCESTEAKFIFQCRERHQFADSVPLKHIRNNARHIVCVTCYDVHTPVIVFPCDKQHTMCLKCFKIYCVVCLNERRFQETTEYGYTLSCPAGCPNSHIQQAHHFHVLGPEEYERYKRFGTEEFVIKEGGVLCPRPQCGEGLLPETNANTIICSTCKYEFCRHCACASHLGDCGPQRAIESSDQSMSASSDVLKKCQWEYESMSLIREISKPCPKCKVKTEKNGGCNHMHCRCGEEWCWICVKTWNQDCMDAHWLD